jgi:hypothetical protein
MHFPLRITIVLVLTVGVIGVIGVIGANAQTQTSDKNFWRLTSWNAFATATDGYTTVSLRSPTHCQVEGEAPELYGKYPRPLRVSAVMGGMFLASTFLSYEVKRYHPRAHLWKLPLWSAPMGYNSAIHARGAIHNWSFCP